MYSHDMYILTMTRDGGEWQGLYGTVDAPGTGRIGPWPYLKMPGTITGITTGLTFNIIKQTFLISRIIL
jgi:hypothetical protein